MGPYRFSPRVDPGFVAVEGVPVLIERVFVIGGILCVVLGGGLAWAFASTGWDYFGLLFAGGVSAGFGALFVYVGEGARRQRLDLLALGESGDPNANARPKP